MPAFANALATPFFRNAGASGGSVVLPDPFFSFRSDAGAVAKGYPFVGPTQQGVSESAASSTYLTGDSVLYRFYGWLDDEKSADFDEITHVVTADAVNLIPAFTANTAGIYHIIFRQVNGGAWTYVIVQIGETGFTDDGATDWLAGDESTYPTVSEVETPLTLGPLDAPTGLLLAESAGSYFSPGDSVLYRIYAGDGLGSKSVGYVEETIVCSGACNIDVSWTLSSRQNGTYVFRKINGGAWSWNARSHPVANFTDSDGGLGALDPSGVGTATIAGLGGLVFRLEDQSGNDHHLIQATAADRPGLTAAGEVSGYGLIDVGLAKNLETADFTPESVFTLVFVGYMADRDQVGNWPCGLSNTLTDGLISNFTTGGLWVALSGSGPSLLNSGETASETTPQVIVVVFNGTSSKIFVDGVLEASGNLIGVGVEKLLLAYSKTLAVVGYNSALTNEEVAAVVAAQQSRYGL
jgi:hypothetical protein